jgi:hypothetical protein
MSTITLYLGLDVHKDSIIVPIAEPGPKGKIRLLDEIPALGAAGLLDLSQKWIVT